ncbi:MAG: TRAP transporter small permease [Anaerovoracaceae bacterium]
MKILDSILDRVEKWASILLFTAVTLVVVLQIIFRLTGVNLTWTEEVARYLFVWLIYFGAIKAVREEKHLKVDIVALFLKEKGTLRLKLFTDVVSIVFWIIITYVMFLVMEKFSLLPQYSPAVHINMLFVYLAPLVCGIFSIIRYVQNIIRVLIEYKELKPSKGGDLA